MAPTRIARHRPRTWVRRPARRNLFTGELSSVGSTRTTLSSRSGRSSTRSRTKTKTKLNTKVKTSKDGPVSDSYFSHSFKKMSLGKFKQLTAVQSQVSTVANQFTWTAGTQGAYGVISWYSVGDLNLMNTTWSTLYPSAVTNTNTTKLFQKKMKGELMLTNQENDIANVTLYDVVARRDISNSNYDDPLSAWIQASTDIAQVNGYKTVGSTPFMYPGFTEMYKILKVTHVDLHSGGHHRHSVTIKPGRMFSQEIIAELGTSQYNTLGKYTHFTLIVAHGFPLNNPANTITTTASGKIDFAVKREYEFYGVSANRSFLGLDDRLDKTLVPATEQTMNDLIGSVQAISVA